MFPGPTVGVGDVVEGAAVGREAHGRQHGRGQRGAGRACGSGADTVALAVEAHEHRLATHAGRIDQIPAEADDRRRDEHQPGPPRIINSIKNADLFSLMRIL